MLDTVDSDELTDWLAFYESYPFGPERLSYEMAALRQVCAAPHQKRKSKFSDWMLDYGGKSKATPEKLKGFLTKLARPDV